MTEDKTTDQQHITHEGDSVPLPKAVTLRVHGPDGADASNEIDPAIWVVGCTCGQPFRAKTAEQAIAERKAHVWEREAAFHSNHVTRLTNFILQVFPDEITPEHCDAVSIAIRLLQDWADHPGGRLEPVVRRAIADLDRMLAAPDGDLVRDEVLSVRVAMETSLTMPPRPGGGPEPVFESDDIAIVRFDRDRFRVELLGAGQTIAEMYAAATGRRGQGPKRGLVEDLADLRDRALAAERALTNALLHSCDGEITIPAEGTPAYDALVKLVSDQVVAIAEASRHVIDVRPIAPAGPSTS